MRIIRYEDRDTVGYGRLLPDGTAVAMHGDPITGLADSAQQLDIEALRLLPPTSPSKIVCLGLNYKDHAEEHGFETPAQPLLFHKPPSALIGSHESIALHDPARHNDEEAELVVVIGRKARRVSRDGALAYVLGYTIGNDVTDRDTQVEDRSWMARAKGFDTYAPVGPVLATDLDPSDLSISASINGTKVQDGNTRDLVFGVAELVSFISHVSTLEPGDLIFTGTPSGVSRINPGDDVEIEIEGIGRLRNPVVAGQSS